MKYDITPYGDNAILINFDQVISTEINNQVYQLVNCIKSKNILGVLSVIPAYCSITLIFDTKLSSFQFIKDNILDLDKNSTNKSIQKQKIKRVPICFDSNFGVDLAPLAKINGLSNTELIDIYCAVTYQVFMVGFLPGFPYMGKTPEILYAQRKKQPKLKVPKGSVGLAGNQTGIYPCDSPGGWQIIGNTPIDLLDINDKTPVLETGDQVSFFKVGKRDYDLIKKDVESGRFNIKSLYVW